MLRYLFKGSIAAGALAAMFAIDAGSAAHAQRGAYCAIFYWHTIDCNYFTARQCLAAVDGTGGHCTYGLNGPPIFVAAPEDDEPPRRRYRRHRRY